MNVGYTTDFSELRTGDCLLIESYSGASFNFNVRHSETGMVPGQTGLIVVINSVSGIEGYRPRKSAMLLTANLGNVSPEEAGRHFRGTQRCTSINVDYWGCLMQGPTIKTFRIQSLVIR